MNEHVHRHAMAGLGRCSHELLHGVARRPPQCVYRDTNGMLIRVAAQLKPLISFVLLQVVGHSTGASFAAVRCPVFLDFQKSDVKFWCVFLPKGRIFGAARIAP